MNPTEPTESEQSAVSNPLETMREGEVVICNIKRHPIGLIASDSTFLALVFIVGALAIAAPTIFPDADADTVHAIGVGIFLFAVAFATIFTIIAHTVYFSNRWIVTSDSITQLERHSLFATKSSQLGLANLENITVHQDGIIANMFGYGSLHAETAGERTKFVFLYCPNPNDVAKKILRAREDFEQSLWNPGQRPGQRPAMPTDHPTA